MAIVMLTHLPIRREDIEALSARMNVAEDPPQGLIVHTAYEGPHGVNVIDVWEAEEDFRRFQETRLGPATEALTRETALPVPESPPEFNIHEVFDVVRGRGVSEG